MSRNLVCIAVASLSLSACSTIYRGAATYASPPMTIEEEVQFDIAVLLGAPRASGLEEAFVAFQGGQKDRNKVAGALLLASDRNCDVYLENLRSYQSAWRTVFSLAGVGLGAAGAIVTGADTARLLSGLAGASSGAQGKLDENLMGGLAAEILVAGVRAGREPIRAEIVANLQRPYEEWPVEIAVADVVRYHGRCNVMSGLTTAQRAVERLVTPSSPQPAAPNNAVEASPQTPTTTPRA